MNRPASNQPKRLSRRRCLMAVAAASFSAGLPARAAALRKGDQVEIPPLVLIDGTRLESADWNGRAAVIVFWSTDCAFCKRHNARLSKLHQTLRTRGSDLRIIGIATDRDPQAVRRHVAEHDLHFPVALDTVGLRARLTDRVVVPMTVLVDRGGRLLMAIPGELSEDDVVALGRQLG